MIQFEGVLPDFLSYRQCAVANRQPSFDVDLTQNPVMRVFLLTKSSPSDDCHHTLYCSFANPRYFTDHGDKRDLPAEDMQSIKEWLGVEEEAGDLEFQKIERRQD